MRLEKNVAYHEDALVRHGYYVRREFRLHNRPLDWLTKVEIGLAFRTNKFRTDLASMKMDDQRSAVCVTTIPEDMQIVELVMARIDHE